MLSAECSTPDLRQSNDRETWSMAISASSQTKYQLYVSNFTKKIQYNLPLYYEFHAQRRAYKNQQLVKCQTRSTQLEKLFANAVAH